MPVKTPLDKCSLRFADALSQALIDAGHTDFALTGARVANRQKYPARKDHPYHPAVVAAWTDGSCLPSEPAFNALLELLGSDAEETLKPLYLTARRMAPLATEESIMLQYRFHQQDTALPAFTKKLAAEGMTNPEGNPVSVPLVHNWMSGKKKPPERAAAAFDRLLPPKDTPATSFAELHQLPELTTEEHLELAESAGRLSTAIRHLRLAMRLDQHGMAEAINAETEPGAAQKHTISAMERDCGNPIQRRAFKSSDVATVYFGILRKQGFKDWASEAREEKLRGLLRNAAEETACHRKEAASRREWTRHGG
jgi:DNA-binding transcriptional regulator YiaG